MSVGVVLAAINFANASEETWDYEIVLHNGRGFTCERVELHRFKTEDLEGWHLCVRASTYLNGNVSQVQFIELDAVAAVIPRRVR